MGRSAYLPSRPRRTFSLSERPVRRLLALIAAALLATAPGAAQSGEGWAEVGAFSLRNLAPRDYAAAPQNWDVVEDPRGVLYTANSDGVLAYDGATWTLIPVPNGSVVRALAVDATGRVFVGAQGEFGYLAPDAAGRLRYVSLREALPPELRNFGDIRSVVATPEGAYFSSALGLFRYAEPEGVRVWALPGSGRRMGFVGGRLLVHERERGLLELRGDSLRRLPGGAITRDLQAAALLPDGVGAALLITRTGGLFRFDGRQVVPFTTGADAFLQEAQVMDGLRLAEGGFAFATLRRGLVVLDASGRLLRVLDRAAGLRDDDAKAVTADRNGRLWIGLNNGLARVDLQALLSNYGETQGLSGFVLDVARFDGRLFAATSRGVRVLAPPTAPGATPRFRELPGLPEFCHQLLATPHGLLAGCDHGVFGITPTGATLLFNWLESAFALARSPRDPNRVYVGLSDGLLALDYAEGRWQGTARVPGFRTEVRHLVEDADGSLWIGTPRAGLFRATIPRDPGGGRVEAVGEWQQQAVRVFRVGGSVLVSTPDGLFQASGDALVPEVRLRPAVPGDAPITHLAETPAGDVWLRTRSARGVARKTTEGYTFDPAPLRLLPPEVLHAFYPDPDGVVWIGQAEGLVRVSPRPPAAVPPPKPLLREIVLLRGDSLFYGGEGPLTAPTLAAHHGALRIHFSAPGTDAPRFQTRLDGLDESWSAWTADGQKEYAALGPGRYTFRVRAQGPDGQVGPEAAFAFVVAPPWHRSGWAYALYVLLTLGAGFGLLRLHDARLRRRNRQLEGLVQARTAEVEWQKRQLEEQNAQIEGQAARLRQLDEAKSRFFANVSHEFRTPLTLTLGPIEDLLAGQHGSLPAEAHGSLQLARRSAYRLLRLVNRLLDLAKLESGHMVLQASPGDLVAFLRETTAAFAPLAERRGLTLTFEADYEAIHAPFDADKLEEVVANLLSNSFKATEAGGRIAVRVTQTEGWVTLAVADTGTGIDAESLSVIFDRFRQGRTALPGTVGTGIGLNLVQELVHLHGGEITVASTVGAGSTFTVRLPLGEGVPLPAPPETQPVHHALSGDGAPVPAGAQEPEPVTTGSDQPLVLVVDDHADIRAYVRQHLEPAYRVAEAPDGEAGLEQARHLLPDLIVSDVMMPRRDGYSLCRALKADPALDHVPLILLTAKASTESRLEGLDAEADDYLTKPFDARELLARVRNLIASRHRLRDRYRAEVVVRPSGVTATSADAALLETLRCTIEANLADADFGVEQLAEAASLSASQLQRRVKALTGLTPVQFITRMRLERAADLLTQRAGSVSEIAYAVGFNAHAYFAQRFREHFGVTPSAYASRPEALSESTSPNG